MTSEGESSHSLEPASKDECLAAFAESIRNFIKKKGPSSVREKLKLGEGGHSEEDRHYLENVASNISGITQRQLMVLFFLVHSLRIPAYFLSTPCCLKFG